MGAAQVEPKRERAFARSRALAAEVEGILEGAEMTRKRHSDVEDFLEAKGREWARRMYEEHLGLRSQLERPVPLRAARVRSSRARVGTWKYAPEGVGA